MDDTYVPWEENVYYYPEKSDLEQIGEVELAEPCYSFDMFVVWRDVANPEVFFWGQDSGCSCPSPFEYLPKSELESGTRAQAMAAVEKAAGGNVYAQTTATPLLERLAQL